MKKRSYLRDENGASSAEFAMVIIPFVVAIFGIINVSLMMYANHTLQYAVEAAARYYSVTCTSSCASNTTVQNYASSHYSGPSISPVFTAATNASGCSHTVTGQGTFPLNFIIGSRNVSLAATACFP